MLASQNYQTFPLGCLGAVIPRVAPRFEDSLRVHRISQPTLVPPFYPPFSVVPPFSSLYIHCMRVEGISEFSRSLLFHTVQQRQLSVACIHYRDNDENLERQLALGRIDRESDRLIAKEKPRVSFEAGGKLVANVQQFHDAQLPKTSSRCASDDGTHQKRR